LAGLSAAYHLKSDYVVLEKRSKAGGACQSEIHNGFVFDRGIHVLHTHNEYVLQLLKSLGVNLQSHTREAWIYSHNTFTRYPFQANTFGLPVSIIKDCLLGFIEANYSRKDMKKLSNYGEWVYAAFGTGIAEHFMFPYAEKFWTIHPKELDLGWIDVRVPKPTLEEIIEGALHEQKKGFGPNAQFKYPLRNGIEAIPMSFLSHCSPIIFNSEVTSIDTRNKTIEVNNEEILPFNEIISTMPLPEIISLINDVPTEIKEAADHLMYNSIICVNLGIDRANISDKHWIYYPEREFVFFRISFPMNLSPYMVPTGKSAISAEISYSKYKPLKITKGNLIEQVKTDLIKAKVLTGKEKIEVANIIEIKYAYVTYDHNRQRNVEIIHRFLKENGIYPAGRYGDWEYHWMDDAILSGRRVAEELNEE